MDIVCCSGDHVQASGIATFSETTTYVHCKMTLIQNKFPTLPTNSGLYK